MESLMELIPESHVPLLLDETKALAILATVMADGSPHATPVWFNTQENHILVNSAKGRVKDRNIRADPRIALTILDPHDPYRYLQIRGLVVNITEEHAREHIDELAKKYMGMDKYPWYSGEIRLTYAISPTQVTYE